MLEYILLIDKDFNYTLYSIPKDEMTKLELEVCHGTKNSNKDNQNIEYRYTIKKNELNKIEKFKSDTTLPEGKFF